MEKWTIGIDEAGRGPLAGPVSVATFALPNYSTNTTTIFRSLASKQNGGSVLKVRDSKRLSEKQREELYRRFMELKRDGLVIFACALVSASTIDKQGIATAIRMGVERSLTKLGLDPSLSLVLLDGSLKAPQEYIDQKTIIHGDDIEPIISAASIVAKVTRDRYMKKLAKKYPEYDFEIHKGYGTKKHYQAIKKYGISKAHRLTFLS